MPSPRQHDAHVRARAAIIRRLIDRAVDWMTLTTRGPKNETGDQWQARMNRIFGRKLAAFRWPDDWGDKLSPYQPYGSPQKKIGTFKDVPTDIIHSIMCVQIPEGDRTSRVPSPMAAVVTLRAPIESPPDVQRRVADRVRNELEKHSREYVVGAGDGHFATDDKVPCGLTRSLSEAKRFTRDEASGLSRKLKSAGIDARYGKPVVHQGHP